MGILDFIFPTTCLNCKKLGNYLCKDCLSKVRYAKQVCIECTKPSIDGFTHIKCIRPQALDGVFSVWNYEGVIRKAILKLKYNFAFDIAKELAENIAKCVSKNFNPLPTNPVLIPIPLHVSRKNWRGFNQTEEIGKLLANKLGWNFAPDVLVRKKKSSPQAELKGDQRKENVKNVFALNPKYKYFQLLSTNYQLLIFDDVLTTGATMKEAGKVLKRSGAQNVWGLTIAS